MNSKKQFEISYPKARTRSGPFDLSLVRATQTQWHNNGLYLATAKFLGAEAAHLQHLKYNLGTSNWRGGATTLWLSDSANFNDGFLTVIIDRFDPTTGLPIDNDFVYVHDRLKDLHNIDFGRYVDTYCLPGTHLVHSNPNNPIVVVRHSITALVGSFHLPQFIWLPVGAYSFINLNCPTFLATLPGSQPVVLFAEPEDSREWADNQQILTSWFAPKGKTISCVSAERLPGYNGDTTLAIHTDPEKIKTLIENLCNKF
jgi:hypothetical protein